ncbi:MAG: YidC/Oxa1 family membrane protein insertase [Candidatus Azotimanducaceae bacterium]|jgi:YidC/Oxa1 family membrane protein insertase
MDLQRIFILLGLAVTSYLLILAWNEDYKQGSQAPIVTQQVAEPAFDIIPQSSNETAKTSAMGSDSIVPELVDSNDIVSPALTNLNNDYSNRTIQIETDVFDIEIDLKGGDIIKGALPKYPAELDTPNDPFVLLDPRNIYSAQSGLIGRDGTDTAQGRPLFQSLKSIYTMGDAGELVVDLTLPENNGVSIIKRFTFRKSDYLFDVEYIVDNQSNKDWQASLFTQIKRDGQDAIMSDSAGMGMQPYTGGATFQEESPYTKLPFDDIEDEPYEAKIDGGYIALVQHYFVSAWVPKTDSTHNYQARKLSNQDIYLFGLTSPTWQIAPGNKENLVTQFYMGPKDQVKLEEISPGLNLTVDYGFLWWLAQPLFALLTFIHSYVNNWGIAIICLTIIVKSLLFPLSAASFRSMAKMRKLQPEMARLKERFGDDKQKFSQAMMELYKKEGANPLGGCLPMLAQMPVFLALYWALMESVELRQAPFFLWIYDLSAMDPYFVLPILMGISMYVTQMMQPEPPDPVQAKVFKLMPIMFTFFFLWFPSGLVLYWLVNNLLSILQQTYVTRQLEKAG